MPIYKIQGPDGRTYRIEGPEGATLDQLVAVIPKPKQEVYDPTEGMSNFEKFGAGLGKAFVDLGRGVGQRLGMVSPEEIAEARRLDAPLMKTGAGIAGNIAGNVAATLPTIAIPGVNTVAGGALTGAALGAMQPTTRDESVLGNMAAGGFVGAALPAVVGGYQALKAGAYDPLVNQKNVIRGALTRAAGGEASPALSPKTQGVKFTTGTASQNEGLSALEEAIKSQVPSSALNTQAQANRNALAGAMRGIAGTPEDVATAMAAREGAADALYGKAFQSDAMRRDIAAQAKAATTGLESLGNVQAQDLSTPGLRALMSRPMFQNAVQQAKQLAANKGTNIGNPLESLEGLHYVKLALDDMANPMASSAIGKNELAAVNSIRNALTEELATVSPLYGNARNTFTQLSQPINQMQVGQALSNKLIPATAEGLPPSQLNAAQLANALRNPDAIARQATGFEGAKMARIMSPEQMATIQGVNADASALAEALRRGSGTGSKTSRMIAQGDMLAQHFQENAPGAAKAIDVAAKIPLLNILTKGAGAIGSFAGDKVKQQMLRQMDEMLANDPKLIADLIREGVKQQQPASQAKQLMMRTPEALMLSTVPNMVRQ